MQWISLVLGGLSLASLALILVRLNRPVQDSPGLSAIREKLAIVESQVARLEGIHREEFSRNRQELLAQLSEMRTTIETRLDATRTGTESRLETVRVTLESRLKEIQESNAKKLDEMRQVVDEKLQSTLEKRLGDAFKQVSERLELVHKGLGEMQTLASGVGDLKKVLTNVKTRGTWGEIQLSSLLEQMLTPDQYQANVRVKKNSQDVVEFALKLPGREEQPSDPVFLPIDSKFPMEDYQRLVEAQDKADIAAVDEAAKALEMRLKQCARDIRDKYIVPPATTDFGILFVPIESLYAEILRRPGLAETLQRDYRVVVAGPSTLSALLNSLQMGFRTLAIQKRSSEVWKILGAVKTEFGKFGEILDKVGKKLQEAQNTISDAASKSRRIEGSLRSVESLPVSEAKTLIGDAESVAGDVG
jgi:DNA recombination protein RmuC